MSTNLSKQKREDLLNKIEEIRKYLKTNLYDENARKLTGYLDELTAQIKGQKYGLVFEEHKEAIDEKLENNLPVLTEEKELFVGNGGEMNFLLEGDNLASLQLLEKTHKGKIDVIYIDPPYNTGNKDFIYDDDFVDSADSFRHSKWLSFMEKRLRIARELLSEKGVIFISIDDNEQADLKLLCDEVFGDNNFVGNLIWQSATDNNPRQLSTEHEYIICVCKNIFAQDKWLLKSEKAKRIENKYFELKANFSNIDDLQANLRKWIKENKESLSGVTHYNNVDKQGVYSNSSNSSNTKPGGYMFDIIHPVTKKPCVKPAFGWRWTEETFWNYEKKGNIEWGIDETTQPHVKKRIDTVLEQLKSIYYEDGRIATKLLEDIFQVKKIFNNPKPINLISRLLAFTTNSNKSATILDFFAGSGTTGHAVLKLNAEDGGKRKFILCTNNENSICRDITYERLKTVITGERKDGSKYSDGLPGSLKYFKVDFVEITEKEYYEYADKLLLHVRELVELENAVDFEHNTAVAIVLTEEELEEFCKKIIVEKPPVVVYLGHDVLLSKAQKELLKQKEISVKIIPQYYYPELNG